MFLTTKCGLSLIVFSWLGLSRAHDDVGVVQVSVNSDRRQAAFDGVKVASNFAFPGQFGFFYKDGYSVESCADECAEFGSTYFQLRKSSGNCGCTRKGVSLGQKARNNDFDIYEIVEKEPTTTPTTTAAGATSEAAMPSCERPSGWCTHNSATYDDTEDCDGDGVADPQCESMATTGESGYIASSDYCDDKWGRGNNIQNCNKAEAGPTYVLGEKNALGLYSGCPSGYSVVDTVEECETEAANALGLEWQRKDSWTSKPFGCFQKMDVQRNWFNTYQNGPAGHPNNANICKKQAAALLKSPPIK